MNAGDERDEWLMAQLARGEREYLEPLVRRYASPLLTFIRRMIGDRHRSEELFQEVFLAVWTKREQYQFPRSFRAWLFGIAVNKCRADYRSQPACSIVSLRQDLLRLLHRLQAGVPRRPRSRNRRSRRTREEGGSGAEEEVVSETRTSSFVLN